jgi:hypothetical protein
MRVLEGPRLPPLPAPGPSGPPPTVHPHLDPREGVESERWSQVQPGITDWDLAAPLAPRGQPDRWSLDRLAQHPSSEVRALGAHLLALGQDQAAVEGARARGWG